ncbi:amphi-Trp domain-containing protein [Halomarina ordinaria]|uniref:Amphi-Trp domain-containing protein n=1 Tax=Halomarina ordinaria TaxID=3033939 RepID=A0ABD5U6A3_9EURY|nr:amphi-Trp domain-containing protein [Halomarina sp. PSRA2]
MTSKTSYDSTMTREEVAAYLHAIADEFASGEEDATIDLGNKQVTVQPSDKVNVDVTVTERDAMLRKNRQKLDLELKWRP